MEQASEKIKVEIPSRLEELTRIEALSERVAKKSNLSDDKKNNLAIAVTEAAGNAIVHGNKKDPKKKVTIEFTLCRDSIKVSISDEGTGFNPSRLSNPLDPQNVMKESGRGIFILKALMDNVTFTRNGATINFVLKKKD